MAIFCRKYFLLPKISFEKREGVIFFLFFDKITYGKKWRYRPLFQEDDEM